jgi:uncharacterized lipoprotein YehR (DUF1307 family)
MLEQLAHSIRRGEWIKLKKVVVILLCLVLLLFVAGCGIREKVTKGISEKVTEGILEQVTGGDINIDGDEITFGGEDGSVTFGSTEWPKGEAADLVPPFEKGTIITSVTTEKGFTVMLEGVEENDFWQYVDAVKAAGFTENPTEYFEGEALMYFAELPGKAKATIYYTKDDGVMQVAVELLN